MDFVPMIVSGLILTAWVSLSLGLLLLGSICLWHAVDRKHQSGALARASLAAAAMVMLVTTALHNPFTIHIAQQVRAAEMSRWQGRTLAEFEQQYGPPDFGALPFLSWRTLPWYSPLRWGSATLAVLDNGYIGAVMVRGFRAAFS